MNSERKALSDPAFREAYDKLPMPERLRRMVAHTMWMADGLGGIPMPIEEACFLARQWVAILERLQALGCLRAGVPGTRSVPWMPELKRCPWHGEHGWKHPDKPWATAPVLGNQFEGDYSCPVCDGRRKYLDLVGLLEKDWDAAYQKAKAQACSSLLALPVEATQEARR